MIFSSEAALLGKPFGTDCAATGRVATDKVISDEGDQLFGDFLAAPFPSSFNITIIIRAIVISRYKEFARAADGAPIRFLLGKH